LAPIAVATPVRTPPPMLLRSTTAVDGPGVATSGNVIAANAHKFEDTARSYPPHSAHPIPPPEWQADGKTEHSTSPSL
jgi:hypothetical protein